MFQRNAKSPSSILLLQFFLSGNAICRKMFNARYNFCVCSGQDGDRCDVDVGGVGVGGRSWLWLNWRPLNALNVPFWEYRRRRRQRGPGWRDDFSPNGNSLYGSLPQNDLITLVCKGQCDGWLLKYVKVESFQCPNKTLHNEGLALGHGLRRVARLEWHFILVIILACLGDSSTVKNIWTSKYIDAKPVRTNVRYLPVLISETTEVCCQIKSHQRHAKLSTPTMRDKCDFGLTNTSKWNEELKASIYKEHRIHRDDSVFCCQGRFNKRVVVWSQKLSNNSGNSWCSWSPYWPWYAHKSWPAFL